jgi:thiamine biosynthesis lipoprotein
MRYLPALLSLVFLCQPVLADGWEKAEWKVMGTLASLSYHADSDTVDPVPALKAELERLNAMLSPWVENSELKRVNEHADEQAVEISNEFYRLLQTSAHYHRLTDGAFDISFAGAGHLYDYRAGKAPDQDRLREAADTIDASAIELLPDNRVRFARPGMRIDLGGIAKGHAVDRCIDILRDHGIKQAWMSLGGDSYVLGQHGERAWQVGIRHPRQADKTALSLPVSDVAVSTSGDYQRYFVRDGQRYHHIINPGSGKSAGELASVTIIADTSLEADALSTSVFVLGVDKGLALVNRLDGVSAVLIRLDGSVHYSDDLTPGDG